MNPAGGCRFEVGRQEPYTILDHSYTNIQAQKLSLNHYLFFNESIICKALTRVWDLIPLKTIFTFCSVDLLKFSSQNISGNSLAASHPPLTDHRALVLTEHGLIVVYFRSEFCENISNEVRMTLININIPFPGLAGRVESAAPSPQFLDMFLSSLLVARCGAAHYKWLWQKTEQIRKIMRAWFVIPPPATIYGARPLNETRLGPGLMLSLSWAQAIKSWFSGSGEMINNSDSAVSVSRPRQVYLACSVCSAAVGSIPAGVSWAACCSVQAGVCSLHPRPDAAVLQSPATASSRPAGGPAVSALGRGDGLLEGGDGVWAKQMDQWINFRTPGHLQMYRLCVTFRTFKMKMSGLTLQMLPSLQPANILYPDHKVKVQTSS